jgi:MFS family permease
VAILVIGLLGAMFGASIGFLVPGIAALYGAGAGGTGALTALYGVGAVVGATVLIRLGDGLPRSRATRLGYAGYGIGAILAMTTSSLAIGLAAFTIVGVGYSLWLTSLGTALQVQLTDAYRGRVTTFYIAAIVGGTPIGSIVGGWLADTIGLRPVFVAYGTIMLLLATLGARRLRFDLLQVSEPTPDSAPDPTPDGTP